MKKLTDLSKHKKSPRKGGYSFEEELLLTLGMFLVILVLTFGGIVLLDHPVDQPTVHLEIAPDELTSQGDSVPPRDRKSE